MNRNFIIGSVAIPILIGGVALFEHQVLCLVRVKSQEVCSPSKSFTINVGVFDAREKGVSSVKVQFWFEGSPSEKFTDSKGYTEAIFSYTQSVSPDERQVKVVLSKDGFKSQTHFVNLQEGGSLPLTFILKQENDAQEVSQPEKTLKREAWDALEKDGKNGISEAAKKFQSAAVEDPNDFQVAYAIGWLDDLNYSLRDNSDYEPYGYPDCQPAYVRYSKALRLLEKNSPKDPLSQEMIVEIGHYLSNRDRDHKTALNLYKTHILTTGYSLSEPVIYMALVSKGIAHFWLGEYEFAGPDFEQALAELPSNQVAYNRGSVFAMYNDYDQAIKWYKAAIYGGKVSLIHYNNQEVILSENLDFDEARRELGFALLLHHNVGETAQERTKRYEEARQEFEAAISNRPDNYLAYVGLGIAQYLEGKASEAKVSLEMVPSKSEYSPLAQRYLTKIEQCVSVGQNSCVDHFQEIEDLSNISITPILTSQGISRMFGNVIVHEGKGLEETLSLEHASLYLGPCPSSSVD